MNSRSPNTELRALELEHEGRKGSEESTIGLQPSLTSPNSDTPILRHSATCHPPPVTRHVLLIAGARQADSGELIKLADDLAPGRVKFLFDVSRDEMPEIYRSMDVFVLTSLFEMMPIALLEAMASGLPVVVNRHPVLEWMVGDRPEGHSSLVTAGACLDLSKSGELAGFLQTLTPEWIEEGGKAARRQAESVFSKDRVIERYLEYYETVTRDG